MTGPPQEVVEALYKALGQIKGINSDCEMHRNYPWQLHCEVCRRFVARELAAQNVTVVTWGFDPGTPR